MSTEPSERAEIAREFAARAAHSSQSQVDDTCSFARAERMLGREYHGRFLIELLQNASDAWRDVAPEGTRSDVRIVLSRDRALLVANEGRPIDASVVIRSLGQIGATNKPKGSAIGHKGIGFKSVLEVTLTPEIYSRTATTGAFDLSVRFDPGAALDSIREATPDWDAMVSTIGDALPNDDPLSRVPVLRYPIWVEAPPDDVLRATSGDDVRFNTVIRLPYTDSVGKRLGLSETAWLEKMRAAFADLTDEILLLLGTFERVTISDELAGSVLEIERGAESDTSTHKTLTGVDMQVEDVTVLRNNELSTRWLLARRDLNGDDGLASEIAVGVRTSDAGAQRSIVSAAPETTSAPFHLFFPTRIATGLPFLLHGYFEVDAGRTGFYGGSAPYNRRILAGLSDLVIDTVDYIASDVQIDVAGLADLFSACAAAPADLLAAEFQEKVFDRLDEIAWVAVADADQETEADGVSRGLASPADLLVDSRPRCNELLRGAFNSEYTRRRTGYAYPSARVGTRGLEFLADRVAGITERGAPETERLWAALAALLRPGAAPMWANDDDGFVALVDLLDYLRAEEPAQVRQLCDGIRGDGDARLLPTVGPVVGVRHRMSPPAPPEAGQRGQLALARVRERTDGEVAPPSFLGVAFLPDGLLDSSQLATSGALLGIREYTVDTVLDRLDGLQVSDDDAPELARFVWRFLTRENLSEFGLKRAMRTATAFDPKAWFWCVPGRSRGADNETQRQVRARALSQVKLPTRNGEWKPASTIAFGGDWADWLADHAGSDAARTERINAYNDLEELAPGPECLLAPPNALAGLLGPAALVSANDAEDDDQEEDPETEEERALHAFLLRLGVTEVPPVEAAVDGRVRSPDQRIPWRGDDRTAHLAEIKACGGWVLKQTSYTHDHVHIAEDFRFLWPLVGDPQRVARALGRGAPLYASLATLSAFCIGCHSHTTRYWNEQYEQYPSLLAHQLRSHAWVPCSVDGGSVIGTAPSAAWWDAQPPDLAGMRQSPLRFLPLAPPGLDYELRKLAHIPDLRTASTSRLRELLSTLRDGYADGTLEPNPRSASGARQAFIGLHRVVYERLASVEQEDAAAAIAVVGVLSELGDELRFLPAAHVRHDNGDFASYRRYFVGAVPFVSLAKDREPVAKSLGVPRFAVEFERREVKDEIDVTDLVTSFVGDRTPELLSLLIFHSLGTQTLELGSQQFRERSRRLANLRILQVDDLVLDATVAGLDVRRSIGEGSDRDLFLDGANTLAPRLYHDIRGQAWEERLRRRIAPHLATLAGNPNYAATFQLLLQADGEAEREEFLLEHGIGDSELDQVRAALGYVSTAGRERSARWFAAILSVLGQPVDPRELDLDRLVEQLVSAGLSETITSELAELGGDEEVRSADDDAAALRLLAAQGIDLRALDTALREMGDQGLLIRRAEQLLRSWSREHGRRIAWILHRAGMDADAAKQRSGTWKVPTQLRFQLDPSMFDVIADVILDLEQQDVVSSREALAGPEAGEELARLAGCSGLSDLDEAVRTLYSDEERAQVLRQRAAAWRRSLVLLAVVVRTSPHDSRASIREASEALDDQLPSAPSAPTFLIEPAATTLASNPDLVDSFVALLTDQLSGAHPDDDVVRRLYLSRDGDQAHFERVKDVMTRPTKERTRDLRRRIETVQEANLTVRVPSPASGPARPTPPRPPRTKKVARIHVEPDQRKLKKLGDEGEEWALALVLRELTALAPDERAVAIDQLSDLLATFRGEVVDRAQGHGLAAREADLEDEELIDELTGFLHLSRHSDGFGFDVLGWLTPNLGEPARPLCLEVKSAKGTEFHVSTAEWARAEDYATDYAFLIVRRSGSGAPSGFDLLIDPATWLDKGLRLSPDGYIANYG